MQASPELARFSMWPLFTHRFKEEPASQTLLGIPHKLYLCSVVFVSQR